MIARLVTSIDNTMNVVNDHVIYSILHTIVYKEVMNL